MLGQSAVLLSDPASSPKRKKNNHVAENVIGCYLLQEELDDIIRYGSKELFADENDEAGKCCQIHYDAAAIDR